MTDRLIKYLSENKKAISICIISFGLVLIITAFMRDKNNGKSLESIYYTSDSIQYCSYLEQKIKMTIESITGNDTVEVMITLKDSNPAAIVTQNNAAMTQNGFFDFTNTNNKSSELTKASFSEIGGVMVIMKSISDLQSLQEIKKAVSTALNISENKIYIIGGAEGNEKN